MRWCMVGAGHVSNIEQPDEFTTHVLALIRGG